MSNTTVKVVAAEHLPQVRLDKETAAAAEDQRLRADPFVRRDPVDLPANEFVRRRLAAGDLVVAKEPAVPTNAASRRATATTSEK